MFSRVLAFRIGVGVAAGLFIVTGCETMIMAVPYVPMGLPIQDIKPGPSDPPRIVETAEDTITVKYRAAGVDSQHEEAEKLISEYCGGPFDGERLALNGWYTAKAKCRSSRTYEAK